AEPVGRPVLWQLSPYVAALHVDDLAAVAANLLGSLFPLSEGERIDLRWHVYSAPTPAPAISGDNELRGGRLKALRAKLTLPGMAVYGELYVTAGTTSRRRQLRQRVASVLRSLTTPYGRLVADDPWYGQTARLLYLRGRYVSAPELAAVAGWPIGGPDLPGLRLGAAKRLVPARELPAKGRVLGVSDFPGVNRPVALSPKASTTSVHVLGPTGTGKSSLLRNLIRDDLEQGRGVLAIETNGDLIQDVIDAIPSRRLNDVVLLDATDTDFAVGLNPFATDAPPSLVADQLGELFQRLWAAYWGPRTAQLTHMGLLTLAQRKGSTLLDLPRLYLDQTFRTKVLRDLDDPVALGPDWQWFESLSAAEQANVISPLLNKARSWVARPAIRGIVGQSRPRITMRQIIEERKVLLVHLPKGLIGTETAQLLGCLVLTTAWQVLAERTALPPERRHPFGIHVDELQDFAAAPVPWEELYAQGRKYGAALVTAHQNLAQLPKQLRETVLANARSKVVFALGAADAKILERDFAPALAAADLQALDPYAVAALVALESGGVAPPVTLTTPPPPQPLGTAQQVRASSRQRYARSRGEIEASLRGRARLRPKAPIGRKRRSQA
ncbi:MAG: type IV secretory system conjugative DNA transfer family protein, partial [Solirubrobacterales bacterium]